MAAGNCLPELSMALVALLLNGSQDIGTGEVFGSCVFDLLAILGVVCVRLPGNGVARLPPGLMIYFVGWAAVATAVDVSLYYSDVETTWPASMSMVALYAAFVAGIFVCHRVIPRFAESDQTSSPSNACKAITGASCPTANPTYGSMTSIVQRTPDEPVHESAVKTLATTVPPAASVGVEETSVVDP